jgi:hypothetical protein
MKNTTKVKATQKNAMTKEVSLVAPKVKKEPTYSNDKLLKLGLAET